MATLRQKKLAEALAMSIENGETPTKKDLLVSVGYPESTATTYPGKVLEQKGVREELEDLGFSEATAKKVVAEILINGEEESARLKAADMVFKVHGTYAPTESKNLNVDVKVEAKDSTKHDSLREEYEAKLRESYLLDE